MKTVLFAGRYTEGLVDRMRFLHQAPMYAMVYRMKKELHEAGHRLIDWIEQGRDFSYPVREDLIARSSVVIVFREAPLVEKLRPVCLRLGKPLLFCGSDAHLAAFVEPTSAFVNPERMTMEIAVEHVRSKGHRRIGLLTGRQRPVLDARERHAKELCERNGMEVDPKSVFRMPYDSQRRDRIDGTDVAIDRIVTARKRKEGPTAFLSMDDVFAFEPMQILQQEGISIPEDLAFVGVNDHPLCQIISPGLTSVRLPLFEDVPALLEMALSLADAPDRVLFRESSPSLTVRKST